MKRFAVVSLVALLFGVPTVYLDHNATTPLDPSVRLAMDPFLSEIWGNPSSIHQIGRRARAELDALRDRCAAVLRAKPSEIVYTSGGTESNNIAVFGSARMMVGKGRHLITSTIEHDAVLRCFDYLEKKEGFSVTRLPVDSTGTIQPADLRAEIRPDTTLVSLMAANNETGTVQPVGELGAICREHGVIFHTDAVQWFGKLPFESVEQFNADLVTVCSHKFYGPRGVGLLYVRSPLLPDPVLFGGAQENERRAGTENLAAIAGFTTALERFVREPVFPSARMEALRARLLTAVDATNLAIFRGSRDTFLPNTLAFTVRGADGVALMAALDLEGICASSGSACSAGSLEPSHVMTALGLPPTEANALVRFSLGRDTTEEEICYVIAKLPGLLARLTTKE